MTIQELEPHDYKQIFPHAGHVFNTVEFSLLNKQKAGRLHFVAIGDNKPRMGITLGERGGALLSPFSAPFGGFCFNKDASVETVHMAVSALKGYKPFAGKDICITLPPPFYGDDMAAKLINALFMVGQVTNIDINYHFCCNRFNDYHDIIERNARKNLRQAMEHNMGFEVLDSNCQGDVARAYAVIKRNREEHGYPLRMTLDDVLSTIRVVPALFFVVTYQGTDVAAAQVFRVSDDVWQVVYWGDVHQYAHLRTMNFLAFRVFGYFAKMGIRVLDIGPSTEHGVPNYGLCSFKQSIGCNMSPKISFTLKG